MKAPEIPSQITLDIKEHQYLLSFQNDEDAYRFDEWWANEGEQIFLDFAENYE